MSLPASFKWIGLALLGTLIAAAVALAATSLISGQIGIGSESITAGDTLAPAFGTAGKSHSRADEGEPGESTGAGKTTSPSTPPAEGKPAEPTEPAEGESGEAESEGGGDGPDD